MVSVPITTEKELVLQIEGRGKTRAEALDAAFATIRKKVDGTLLRMEPLDIEITNAEEIQYHEKFLLLFFKRVRSDYYLQLNVRVRVILINLEEICFQKRQDNSLFR